MGSRPAKAGVGSATDSGPNGSDGDATPSGWESASQEQQQQQGPDQQELQRLRAALERMESQVEALKVELNKEIELNSELRTEASRQQQTTYLAVGAAVAAAASLAALLYRRR